MLTPKKKQKIIEKYRTHANDTGSSQVQIAILTEEIKELVSHLKTHKKDHSSRRGLLRKLGERRRLLRYLWREDAKGFEDLVKKLKLKIAKKFLNEEEEEAKELLGGKKSEENLPPVTKEEAIAERDKKKNND